ncbi:MAG: DUF5696 domain-containing protein [Saccharofermentanales bacterium]
MRQKYLHKYNIALSALLIFMSLFSGCSSDKTSEPESIKADSIDYTVKDLVFDAEVRSAAGFYTVAGDDSSELLINGQTTEIAVRDKVTGTMWYSNPQDRKNDKIATGANNVVNSSMIFYYDQKSKNSRGATFAQSSTLNSYYDSVIQNQFDFYRIKNGVRVNYQVGTKDNTYICPQILSIERYKEITKKMSTEDLILFNENYVYFSLSKYKDDPTSYFTLEQKIPISKQRDVYAFAPLTYVDAGAPPESSYLKKQIQEIMQRIGYTQNDLNKDNEENLIVVPKSTSVYFTLSVEYTLDNSDLVVNVHKDSIRYDDTIFKLTGLSLLPFFGAAGTGDSGYLFVPDGSGALINLNNGKLNVPSYKKLIYGKDVSLNPKNLDDSQIYLPVYGIKQNDQAFLAIIEKGDASCVINADISGRENSYNYIKPSFNLLNSGQSTSPLLAAGGLTYYQEKPLQSDLQIRYMLLTGTKANYTDMARGYQKYLLDNSLLHKQSFDDKIPLYIDAIGAITYNATFLGIPYISELALTSYSQAKDILAELESKGVGEISLQYTAWCNKGIDSTVSDKADLVGNLGKSKDFAVLAEYTESKNIDFFPDVNFAYTKESGLYRFIYEKTQAARFLDDQAAFARIYSKSMPRQSSGSSNVIISPHYYGEMLDKFTESYNRFGISGLGMNSLGTDLNADYRKGSTIDRQMAEEIIRKQLSDLRGSDYKLSVSGANAYTLEGASFVNNIPVSSNENYLFDYSIPFYQIVLHGIIPYSGEPVNLSSDYDTNVLKLIETGTIPAFQWMYADNSVLKYTDANYYGTNYALWIDQAVDLYNEVNTALADCQTSSITRHNVLAKGLYMTEYSNGFRVYVNYNDNPADYMDIHIDARAYKVVKGGETN